MLTPEEEEGDGGGGGGGMGVSKSGSKTSTGLSTGLFRGMAEQVLTRADALRVKGNGSFKAGAFFQAMGDYVDALSILGTVRGNRLFGRALYTRYGMR